MTIFRNFLAPSGHAVSCLALAALALLASCGEPARQNETADEYAARINAAAPAAADAGTSRQTAAKISTPLPGAAPGPMERGTTTDPAASSCGATGVADFLGQADSPDVRQAIAAKAKPRAGVRIVRPGEAQTQDFNNNRLNVMLDASGVIRDLRCG